MLPETALRSLKLLLPKGQVFTERSALIAYEADAGLDKGVPDGVVFPHSVDEVARIVRWADTNGVALIGRGAGTGLSGGAVADRGGVVVAFSHMQQILAVDASGRSARVEPAVINLSLDERVKGRGLYYPPDPASQRASTIGGNVAENSGGPHCFKYGVTTNYITGLDVVLADGRAVRVGGRALDYPEYDLCGMITGSEGTLALITAVTVRLVRNPPGIKTLLVAFDSVEQAGTAVSAIIATGLVPAAMEMMDQKIVRIIEEFAHAGLSLDAGAVLIIEVDGYPESLEAQMDEIERILGAHGGRDMRIARNEEERARIWFGRKSAAGALTRLTPAYYTVDITVPRSCLATMLGEVNQICDRYGLRAGHVFHAGDGNLHPLILIPNPEDPALIKAVHAAGWEMVERCVAMGGSLTGEHGVGIEKRQYMGLMHNAAELAAMWDIKQVFDPRSLLNPGKIFPLSEAGNSAPFAGYVAPQAAEGATGPAFEGNIFTPKSAEEAAQGLLALGQQGRSVSIRSCAPATMEGVSEEADVLLCTEGLRGIKVYAADDLYVTVGAGTSIAEIQDFLAAHQQQIALASPWPEATIGGLVAANINAPLRMRYGAIRDQVLCVTAVLADGRVIRSGRPITKNVAGYDLTKAFIGSHGTLGLITDVMLKFVGMPRARRTVLVPIDDLGEGLRLASELLPLALVASALVVCKGCETLGVPHSPYLLAYTAEGLIEDVKIELNQVRKALRAAGGPEAHSVEAPSGTNVWVEMLSNASGQAVQVRVGVPPSELPRYAEGCAEALNKGTFVADIASGLLYASRLVEDVEEARAWVAALRQPALTSEGYAILLDTPHWLRGKIDRWGYQSQGISLMRGLKSRWDPQAIIQHRMFL